MSSSLSKSFRSLFWFLFPAVKKKPEEALAGAQQDAVDAEDEETRTRRQHMGLLIHDGVPAWNKEICKSGKDEEPSFWGLLFDVDFVAEAQSPGARIWGKPVDLAGPDRVVLAGAFLKNADLSGSTISGGDMRGVNLSMADLSGTKLQHVNLDGANLAKADLRNADLRHANLTHCDLRNANLTGANLEGANFAWSDMTGAICSADQFAKASYFGTKLANVHASGFHPRWLVMGRQLLGQKVQMAAVKALSR